MPVYLAKLQQPTPIWHHPSNLRVWSICQANGRTWKPRFRPSFQQSWKAATVIQLQEEQVQPWPTGVKPHWQPSLDQGLKIAGQSGLGKQPGFAIATQQSVAVDQPCSMLQTSWGVPQAATESTHRGPNHANQFQFNWHSKEGNQPYSRNHV